MAPSRSSDGSDSATPAAVRRLRIAEAVGTREFVRVGDLSEQFGLSDVTIRSDLDHLEQSGVLRRVHGGAVSTRSRTERAFEETEGSHQDEKLSIARAAADLVTSGDTLILDVGTTTTAIARELLTRAASLSDVVIFTNALNIALALEPAIPNFTVVVTGGTLRPLQHSLVDPLADVLFERVRVGIAFVGCNGVDARAGVTNLNLPEAEVKRRMLRAAAKRIVVADGSKIGEVTLARLCGVTDIDLLITSGSADADQLAQIREHNTEVLVADTDVHAASHQHQPGDQQAQQGDS